MSEANYIFFTPHTVSPLRSGSNVQPRALFDGPCEGVEVIANLVYTR